jgi:hypothetical protein
MKTLLTLLTILGSFFAPIKALILLTILFVIADTIFGIYATIKLHGKESFRSGKLFNIVVKTFFYASTIVLSFLIDKFIFGGAINGISFLLSKAATLFWIYIESKSLDETSMKLGNRSVWVVAKEAIFKYQSFKKDINKKEENN